MVCCGKWRKFRPRRLQPSDLRLVVTRTEPTLQYGEVTIRYQDKHLTCRDCLHSFTFSAADQGLYGELGYEPPNRCRTCRKSLEAARR